MRDDITIDPEWRRREGFPDRATVLASQPFKATQIEIELLFRTRPGPEYAFKFLVVLESLKNQHPDVPILPRVEKRMIAAVLRAAGLDRVHEEDHLLWTWRYQE